MQEQSVNFDQAADFYDETRGFPDNVAQRIAAFIAAEAPLTTDTHLLEVGIGTGRIALPLAPHAGTITGCDISRQMMLKLREKQTNERIQLTEANAMQLPLVDDHFDFALISHVLHLVPDPPAILDELQRVIKPGGYLLNCFSRSKTDTTTPLDTAWQQHKPDHRRGGYSWQDTDAILRDADWTIIREPSFDYEKTITTGKYLDNIRNRVWSSMWEMSDDDIQAGVEAVEQAIEEHYNGDLNATYIRPRSFVIQICEPPA